MGAVRLFLAMVVAVGHLQFLVLAPWKLGYPWTLEFGMNAGFAVMYFYMISGFLMSLVLSQKYPPGREGTTSFYKSRFIRIFCLYWPIVGLTLLEPAFRDPFLARPMLGKLTALLPFGLDWVVAFAAYPAFHWDAAMPGLNQAWTLGAELTFYILAPWLLRSRWPVVIAFVLSVATRAWFVHAHGFDDRWTYMFAPSTFLFFLLGHFMQSASQRMHWLRRGWVGAGCLLGSALFLMIPRYTEWDTLRFWLAALAFALSLPGAFHGTKHARLFNALGELSYPIYLVHILVLIELTRLGWFDLVFRVFGAGDARALPTVVISFSFFAVLIAVGFLLHWLVERPVARGMRWVLDRAVPRVAVRPVPVPVPLVPD